MFEWVADAVTHAVEQYGFVALFAYMVLETAFLLHFAPSELVVPFAASRLVHGPATFAFFVVDATLGATFGSVLAYVALGVYGEHVLSRYGRYVRVTADDVERSQRWFRRYGESSVAWGRLLPVMRALVSVPAGVARMRFPRFVAYSAAGALVFNTALTALVYRGASERSPLAWLLAQSLGHPAVTVVAVGTCAGIAAFSYRRGLLGGRDVERTPRE